MTAVSAAERRALHARVASSLTRHLGQHVPRLGWDASRLADFQRERLRVLLGHAAEHSPFHARRLRGFDTSRLELADLPALPTMTKDQMMAGFDEIVTDRRLTRRRVEQHLAASTAEPAPLLGRYVCLASGGSSGLRGVFVQTVEEYTDFVASVVRTGWASMMAVGRPLPPEMVVGIVAAASPVHSSCFGAAVAVGPPVHLIAAPATLPLPEIVRRLNAAQPPALLGYSSKLAELAREQRAGRLRIAPRSVAANAEVLTARDRAAIADAFGVPVINQFVSTEGLVGQSEPGGPVLRFASDLCLAELVDADNQPVPDGTASSKVLVTNLHNLTQPLIRYELTDRFVRPPGSPHGGYLLASVEGRADEPFRYGRLEVHPHVLRSTLVAAAAVREYQVRQTERGVDVDCVSDGAVAAGELAARLEQGLRRAGLAQAQVSVRMVDAISRDPLTGKARRFIPIRPAQTAGRMAS
jgi:phenylacetate-CoA ligase